MALFKMFHGTEKELNTQVPIVEGRNYFLTDTGKMFIDTAQERICLNAEGADVAIALKNGDEELTAKNIVKTNDIIGVGNGGTGAKEISQARKNLLIDRAIANIINLPMNGWIADGEKVKQVINLPSLTCGAAGNVPPIISQTDQNEEFILLDSVEADPVTKDLTFIARIKPQHDFNVIVTDNA